MARRKLLRLCAAPATPTPPSAFVSWLTWALVPPPAGHGHNHSPCSSLTLHSPRHRRPPDKHYSDQDTFAILGVTSEVLNLPIPEVLHQIGDYQLDSLLEKGFGPLVRTLGATFFEMLSNLE